MNKSRKMLLSNNKKSILINVLLVLLASAEVIYSESDVDSFIVDDDKEETVKKSMLLSSGSMALGFMPKKKGSVVESFLPTVSGSSLHIKPSISLEKSLKTLDISGQKREILPKPSDSKKHNSTNNTIATTRAINTEAYNVGILKGVENIARNSTDDKNATSSVVKKTANLNVITNTSITGFLSKDPKFSIGDVGNQKDKEAVKENESEEKLHKNTTRSKLIGLKETSSYEEPIKKSNLHLVNPASFLMPLSEPLLVDRNRQENAVKKGVKLASLFKFIITSVNMTSSILYSFIIPYIYIYGELNTEFECRLTINSREFFFHKGNW